MDQKKLEQNLHNYIEGCRSDWQPIYLLDDSLKIVWSNDSALKMPKPSTYWRDLLAQESLNRIMRSINLHRFYIVPWKYEGNWIVMVCRVDCPAEHQYFELSLWSHEVQPKANFDINQNITTVLKDLDLGNIRGAARYRLFTNMALTEAALSGGYFNSPTGVIGPYNFFKDLAEVRRRLLAFIAVVPEFAISAEIENTFIKPKVLTEVIGLLLQTYIPHCLPGDKIIVGVEKDDKYIAIQFSRETKHGELSENFPLPSISSPPVALSVKLAKWMGGSLKIENKSALKYFLHVPLIAARSGVDIEHFHYDDILLRSLSGCLPVEKLGLSSHQQDFKQNWYFSLNKFPDWGSVDSYINAILERVQQFNYSDIYGVRIRRNLSDLKQFHPLERHLELRFSGISRAELTAVYRNKTVPRETLQKLAYFYGLTVDELEQPSFLTRTMAGSLDPNLEHVPYAPAALLVLNRLVRDLYGRAFETSNRAFRSCSGAILVKGETGKALARRIKAGVKLLELHYFDRSKSIRQKLGDNLTIARLREGITVEEAAQQAGVLPTKLYKLEAGDTSDVYCRELDRLCRAYHFEYPTGLFIGGYVLTHLWRNYSTEFFAPLPSAITYSSLIALDKELNKEEWPMAILSIDFPFVDQYNKGCNKVGYLRGIRKIKPGIPLINIFRWNIYLWLDGFLMPVCRPPMPEGTVYLLQLNLGLGSGFFNCLAVFQEEGRTFDPDSFVAQIQSN